MNRFAALLDRLGHERGRTAKIRLMAHYFRTTPDPERGYGLAALTGALSFANAKPGLVRALITARVDPILFALSYDFVGDLSETAALMWPTAPDVGHNDPPSLSQIIEALHTTPKRELPARLAAWLDELDDTGRWALLKLITGALRVGVSARLAKTAVASLADLDPDAVELVWPGLTPPYLDLFAWVEGRGPAPRTAHPAPFRPVMLSHPVTRNMLEDLDPAAFQAEWKWDGIRVQMVRRGPVTRLYSRTGEDISAAFPDLLEGLGFEGAVDGELLIVKDGQVQGFNVLQQRLNRKSVTPRLLREFPAHVRAYDLLADGAQDVRDLTLLDRRARLERLVQNAASQRLDLSPLIAFSSWAQLAAARADPASAGAGQDAEAIEGVMLKRIDSPYLPGRPTGPWWKWKRDPDTVDAVLMYAQRGHGKRSSYYSDYTFGVWTTSAGTQSLVPVGKAYFGFTDAELLDIDRFVRTHTVNRFGPVREVVHTGDEGLVLEIAFEGVARSARHRSGLALRFPRVARLRWDKPPREADRLEHLERRLRSAKDAHADLPGAKSDQIEPI